jgi:CRISPR-associated protein Cas2
MQRYIVAYDIPDNRRRKEISDVLEAYGKRVNYSVFEIVVKSKAQIRTLEARLLGRLNAKEDSLRLYALCDSCLSKSWSLGDEPAPFESDAVYFF